ncbi:predicted protein, partial [Postia placenta Mad-698-R]
RTVGWITQLVVDTSERRQSIATVLLQRLKASGLFDSVTVVGLASSHPAACAALAKLAGACISIVDTGFIAENARNVLSSTTVDYLKSAKLHGSLFGGDFVPGTVSLVFTNFYVDHDEPLAALREVCEHRTWCLGDLLEGHEFICMAP